MAANGMMVWLGKRRLSMVKRSVYVMLNRQTRSTMASNFVEAIEKLAGVMPLETADAQAIVAEIASLVAFAETDNALAQAVVLLQSAANPDYDPSDGSEYPEGCGP